MVTKSKKCKKIEIACALPLTATQDASQKKGGTRRHPGGTQEALRASRAPEGSWTQELIPLCSQMLRVLFKFQFHDGVLRVGVTKYCKLQ